jgi:hypothetical protein
MLTESFWDSPVELYLFQVGDSTFYSYTNAETPIVFSGRIYQPITITRDGISSSGTLDKTKIKVTTPLSAQIAEVFRIASPGFKVTLRIFAGSVNAQHEDFPVIWVGRVIQSSREPASGQAGEQAVFSCEPASTTMKHSGLRAQWQLSCRHVLYKPRCGASEVLATVSSLAVAIGPNWIDFAPGWEGARPMEKYVTGKVTWEGDFGREQRRILAATATRLTLAGTTSDLVVGAPVDIVLGCNRTMVDCQTLHDRIQSFGGQPFIPTENPISKSQA